MTKENIDRCSWPQNDSLMIEYHDSEWGVPLHDDRKLFEFIVLDAFQAGLSWRTILYKRENFRKAFEGYNIGKISKYSEKEYNRLINDAGIVRNKLKVASAIDNAKAFLKVQQEFGSFDKYIWQFTGGKPLINEWQTMSQVPAFSEQSNMMSKDLKKRGFRFVGSTICYAFMQAAGMVNDHTKSCFRHKELIGKL